MATLKRSVLSVLCLLICMVSFTSCEEESSPFVVEVIAWETGMDTVSVTFSESISEITMPGTITFGSSSFQFMVEDANENEVSVGLLEYSDATATFVVLGKSQAQLTGDFTLTVATDEDDPLVIERSDEFSFQSFIGSSYTMENTGGQLNDANGVMVFVYPLGGDPSAGDSYIQGLISADFTAFDTQGTRIPIASCTPSESGYRILFSVAPATSAVWIRLFKENSVRPSSRIFTDS